MTAPDPLPESDQAPILPVDPSPSKIQPAPAIIIDEDPSSDADDRELAYDAQPEWDGVVLRPWSFDREAVFYSQRRSMGAPPLDDVNDDISSFLADAARILWLCSHDRSEITALRSKPAVMQDVIDDWAELAIPRGSRMEATLTALRIFNHGNIKKPIPVEDGTPSGN